MSDKRLFRNLPVLFWWVVVLATIWMFPWVLFVGAMVLIAATPFSRWILDRSDERPVPLTSLNMFSELGNMTAFSMVKAMVYDGRIPNPMPRKILDKSKEGK
jgi:hypothetical protein